MCLLQGKSGELRKSCQPSLNNDTWDSSILNLVEEGWCPSYLVPSTSVNRLCLPQIALATPEQAANMSIIMERIQVSSVEMLEPKKVLEGSKYALEKLAIRGFWEKSLLLSRLPAADALLGLAPVSARFCLLKIPSFLIYLPVNQYFPYAFDIDLITVILFLHVSFNPCAK